MHELPGLPSLPEDLEAELAAFDHLSDDVLWLLANNTLSMAQQEELATLNEIAQQHTLTSAERQRQQALLDAYERVTVRRAHATTILKVRGHKTPNKSIVGY